MEAVGTRRVRSGQEYDYLFPPPTGNDETIKKSADVYDTVQFIQKQVPKTTWQTKKFAKFIKGKTLEETCSGIWHFLYDHIPYKRDEDGTEQIRSPRRSWYDRNRPNEYGEVGIDCDCFSTFISSTLLAMNPPIPHKYRITKYPKEPPEVPRWQHIYIVVPKDGKLDYELNDPNDYIVLDCVKNRYNEEEPYLEYKDFNATMKLDYLDGLDGQEEYEIPDAIDVQDIAAMYDEEELGKIGQWIKKAAKNVGTAVKTTVKKVGDAAGKVIRTINKVANPATILLRNGFLLAMKLNIMNVAKRLRYAYMSDAQAAQKGVNMSILGKLRKIVDKAETIYWQAGGKKDNLKLAILKGKGNSDGMVALSGLAGHDDVYMDMDEYNIIHGNYGYAGLGALPAAIAPAMAAIGAVAAALKEIKGLFPNNASSDAEFASDAEEAPAQEIVVEDTFSEDDIMNYMVPEQSSLPSPAPSQTPATAPRTLMKAAPTTPATEQAASPPPAEPEKEGFFQRTGKWIKENPGKTALFGLVAVGVGVGGYMLLKKKKKAVNGLAGLPRKKRKAAPKKRKTTTGRSTAEVKAIKIR
jgi:hypothetical protein